MVKTWNRSCNNGRSGYLCMCGKQSTRSDGEELQSRIYILNSISLRASNKQSKKILLQQFSMFFQSGLNCSTYLTTEGQRRLYPGPEKQKKYMCKLFQIEESPLLLDWNYAIPVRGAGQWSQLPGAPKNRINKLSFSDLMSVNQFKPEIFSPGGPFGPGLPCMPGNPSLPRSPASPGNPIGPLEISD